MGRTFHCKICKKRLPVYTKRKHQKLHEAIEKVIPLKSAAVIKMFLRKYYNKKEFILLKAEENLFKFNQNIVLDKCFR